MRRGEVGLAIGLGILVALAGFFTPVGMNLFGFALQYWYIGALLTAFALLLVVRDAQPRLRKVLGSVGIAWLSSVVSWYAVLVLAFIVIGPLGP